MYSNFFGFRSPPFEDRIDTRFLYVTPAGDRILTSLEHDIHHSSGITLVLGQAGSGKTLIARALVARLLASDHVAFLSAPVDGEIDVLRETCKGFEIALTGSEDSARCEARLQAHLSRLAEVDHRSVLIVDCAEQMTDTNLSVVCKIAELRNDRGGLLTVILLGHSSLADRLNQPSLVFLAQKVGVVHEIELLTAEETSKYIRHRLIIAGIADTSIFEPGAARVVHAASGGNPRLINRFCHEALVTAYRSDEQCVSESIAATVTADFADGTRTPHHAVIAATESRAEPFASAGYPQRASPSQSVSDAPEGSTHGRRVDSPDAFDGVDPRTQAAAAELSLLIGRGEDLARRLRTSIAPSKGTTVDHTDMSSATHDIEHRLLAVIERAEDATERAARTEARLSDFAEGLTEKADTVRQHLAELLRGLEAGETMRTDIEKTMQRASAEVAAADETIVARARELANATEEVRQTQTDLVERTWNLCREKAHQILREDIAAYRSKWAQEFEQSVQAMEALVERAGTAQTQADCTLGKLKEREEEVGRRDEERMTAMERRFAGFYEKIENRICSLERHLDEKRVASESRDDERMADMQRRVVAWHEKMESRMRSLGRSFEEKNAAIESRANAIQEAQIAFEEQLDIEDRARQASVKAIEARLRTLMEKTSAQIGLGETALESHKQACEKIAAEVLDVLQTQTESCLRGQGDAMRLAAHQLQELERRLSSLKTELAESADEQRRKAQSEIEAFAETLTTMQTERVSNIRDRLDAMSGDLSAGEDRCRAVVELSKTLNADMDTAVDRLATLQATMRDTSAEIEERFDRANLAKTDLMDSVKRGEEMLRETDSAAGQIETLMHDVRTTLVDLGAAAQRVDQAQAQMNDAVQVHARVSTATKDAARVEELLSEVTSRASNVRNELTAVSSQADGKVGQLSSHQAAASRVLMELAETNKESHDLIAHINQSIDTLKTQFNSARDETRHLSDNLELATRESQGTSKDLNVAVACATELVEKLAHMTESAVEVRDTLVPHMTESNALADKLREALENAAAVVAQEQELRQTLEGAAAEKAHFERVMEETRALDEELQMTSSRAGQERLHLSQACQSATDLVKECKSVTEKAHAVGDQLTEFIEEAAGATDAGEHILGQFTKHCETLRDGIVSLDRRAQDLDERLTRSMEKPNAIVTEAQTQAAHLEHVTQIVGKVFARLSTASLEANERAEAIEKVGQFASDCLETLGSETERASNVLKQWTEEALRVQQRLEQTIASSPSIQQTHTSDSLHRIANLAETLPHFANPARAKQTLATEAAERKTRATAGANTAEPDGGQAVHAASGPRLIKSAEGSRGVEITRDLPDAADLTRQQEIAGMIADAKAAAAKGVPAAD